MHPQSQALSFGYTPYQAVLTPTPSMREVGRLHAAIIDANASSGFYISARGLFARKMRAQRFETEAAQIAKSGHPLRVLCPALSWPNSGKFHYGPLSSA